MKSFPRQSELKFQSSIAPKGNRYVRRCNSASCSVPSSNPRSPRRAIATSTKPLSISKPDGSNPRSPRRAIATRILDLTRTLLLFQSSIAPKGNRYIHAIQDSSYLDGSNPRSPRRAIATKQYYRVLESICSNPRSPRRAIATGILRCKLAIHSRSNPRSPRRAIATLVY